MPKDIYKTFKRSISAVTGGSSESPSTSSAHSHVKYRGGTGRTWIHPPDFLINGRVEYTARFLGTVETAKPHGSEVAREAIHAIRFQRDLKRSEQSREGAKLQKVDIQISIDNVLIADNKTKLVLYTFPLGRISFCADDKDDKRMFSFIARAEGSHGKHNCFAFTSEKLAEEITLTIGEAFDLAYKRFLDKNRNSLENQKQIFVLRKRIAELEAENQVLSERLAEVSRRGNGTSSQMSLMDMSLPPALPSSPMPLAPPKGVAPSIYSSPRKSDEDTAPLEQAPRLPPSAENTPSPPPSGPAPTLPPPKPPAIVPPPPVVPRRTNLSSPTSAAQQLEGLKLGEPKEDMFDDSFDPRADENKNKNEMNDKKQDYDPFGDDFITDSMKVTNNVPSSSDKSPKTAADFQAMIDTVEKKLAAIEDGKGDDFEFGHLQTGELRGIDTENEYGTPSDRLNPRVMNLKQ